MSRRNENSAPTIRDVARACGVSATTVSYVINGKSVLKDDTRERIFRTMKEMNYHPSAVARGLNSKKVNTIGVLLSVIGPAEFVTNPYSSGLLQGIYLQAQREGCHVTLFTLEWENAEISGPQLRDGRTDGIVVVAPPLYSDVLPGLAALKVPVIGISAPVDAGVAVVDVDNEAGLRLTTQHLLELGHKRIAYLTGNDDLASYIPRRAGFCNTMQAAGLDVAEDMILLSSFDGKLAFEQTSALLRQPNRPTAIIAGNDSIALAVIDAARCSGLHVPRDLSVVGFDDTPAASLITPNLTTIHQPLVDIGEKATALLVERTSKPFELTEEVHLLAPQLVVRGSSGPLHHVTKRR